MESTGFSDGAFAEESGFPYIPGIGLNSVHIKREALYWVFQKLLVNRIKFIPSSQSHCVFILSICDRCCDSTQMSAGSACEGMIIAE